MSLTFDRFRQDQVLQLLHFEEGGRPRTNLFIDDEADGKRLDVLQRARRMAEIEKLPPDERAAARAQLLERGDLSVNRVRLGTTEARSSALTLSDAQGRPRLVLQVTAAGEPTIEFLDEKGQRVKRVSMGEP